MTPPPTEHTTIGQARDLWRHCHQIVAQLTIPDPFDMTTFVGAVAARRGRPIEMIPVTTEPGTPCGLLATTHRADYIVYAANTTALHREHIQLHEIAHLVCGHAGTAELSPQVAALLMPTLPIDLVHRILGRTTYTERQEQEAELLASLIRYPRSPNRTPVSARPPAGVEITTVLHRLGGLFAPRPTGS